VIVAVTTEFSSANFRSAMDFKDRCDSS
jgi:hypothetical protein